MYSCIYKLPPRWLLIPPVAPAGGASVWVLPCTEGRYKATWKREFKLPWSKAGLLKSSW